MQHLQKTGGTSFKPDISPCPRAASCPLTPYLQVTCNEISRRPSLFHSVAYKMLFPQPLCFDVHAFFMGGGVYLGVYPLSAQSSRRASRGECEEPRPHPSRLPAPYIFTSLLPSLVASLFPSSTIAALPSGGEMSFS